MPSNPAHENAAETQADAQISFAQTVRDAGFKSFDKFLLAYGLRVYDVDDVEEGKKILRAMFPERGNI